MARGIKKKQTVLGEEQINDPKGVIADRNGVKGRLYKFSAVFPEHIGVANFGGRITTRLEAFVPDSPNYTPVYVPPPITCRGLQKLHGKFIPSELRVVNKGITYYPPILPGQAVDPVHKERAKLATKSTTRTYWDEGDDFRIARLAVPTKSMATEQQPQLHGHHQGPVPKYEAFGTNQPNLRNTTLPERELIDGVWGYRLSVEFPEYKEVYNGKLWTVKPLPLEKHWVPWTKNYRFYMIQPVDTFGRVGRFSLRFENKTFRYWPPRFPGQRIKEEWEQRVARADRGDQIEFPSTPLPTGHDPKEPVPALDNEGNVRGYTYTVAYPPLKTTVPQNVGDGGRRVLNTRVIATFPGFSSVFVPNREYYEPVTIKRPTKMSATVNYAPIAGQSNHGVIEKATPANYQFLYFPPPKEGEKMDNLSDEYKMAADPANDVRVYIMDTDTNQLLRPPRGRKDPVSEGEARWGKSKKGIIGGQPSALMKFAVLNRARQPPPPSIPVPPVRPPRTKRRPSQRPMGSLGTLTANDSPGTDNAPLPPPRTKRRHATGTAATGTSSSKELSGSAHKSPTAPKSGGRADPLYPYTAEEAGSGPESDDEDGPSMKK